jgi:hypothetical protein
MSETAALEYTDTEAGGDGPGLRVPFTANSNRLSHPARRRLTTLVITKLALDVLFVVTLAVYSHAVTFHPFFSGSLDHADGTSVRGWVVDRAQPDKPVEVHLYVDGKFAAVGLADQPRPDVSAKGYAQDERHGFIFNFDPPLVGEHEARVYAAHASRSDTRRTLQQIGNSFRFDAK